MTFYFLKQTENRSVVLANKKAQLLIILALVKKRLLYFNHVVRIGNKKY